MIFKKDDMIKVKKDKCIYAAVCVDDSIAIFAPVVERKNGVVSTKYKNMFAYANQDEFRDTIEDKFEFVDVI